MYLSGLTLFPVLERSVVGLVLHADTIGHELVLAQELFVLLALELGEAPLVRHVDLLTAGKLELGTTQRLDDHRLVLILGTHRHDRLADVDACDCAERLAEGATHTRLQTIGACARQHLVDADDVEGMDAHADVEGVLAAVLDKVLVGADARRLETLGRELLILVGHQVHAEWELLALGPLAAQVEDTDLGILK